MTSIDRDILKVGDVELVIRRFAGPPQGFDPQTADERQLLSYGLPRRPDQSQPMLQAHWDRAFGKIHRYVRPQFQLTDGRFHGPLRRHERSADNTSTNWSGTLVTPPAGESFQFVSGQWTVPDSTGPGGAGDYYSSVWIGIDGGLPTSDDVVQAGTDSDIHGGVKSVYAWFEWFPFPEIAITNFTVSAGDLMSCSICTATTGSNISALGAMGNLTTGDAILFSVDKPGNVTFSGNCAEWIVEAPSVCSVLGNCTVLPLANFGAVYIDQAAAGTNQNTTLQGGGPSATLISLFGSTSNQLLSEPTVENDHLLKITRLDDTLSS